MRWVVDGIYSTLRAAVLRHLVVVCFTVQFTRDSQRKTTPVAFSFLTPLSCFLSVQLELNSIEPMAALVAAVWSPLTIAATAAVGGTSECRVCMHTVPGQTCDQIAIATNDTHEEERKAVCVQLHELYDCDCSNCKCYTQSPSPPPSTPTLPPPVPPAPPVGPPGEDPIQIFALALLVFVIGALCGALCLVGSCLLGWLDQGALRSPAAPMRHPPAATHHHTTTTPPPHTTHRRRPPPSRSTQSLRRNRRNCRTQH